MSLLEVDALRAGYGRIEILHGISLRLEPHSLCAIVGANGAGKTTLLLAISGIVEARGGSVRFDGRDTTRAASHVVVRAGLSHVPEGRRMLATMSVDENLLVAASLRRDLDGFAAGSLSAENNRCSRSRALVVGPKALLLDEPSMGLAPKLVATIFAIVAEARARDDHAAASGAELLASPEVTRAYLGSE